MFQMQHLLKQLNVCFEYSTAFSFNQTNVSEKAESCPNQSLDSLKNYSDITVIPTKGCHYT